MTSYSWPRDASTPNWETNLVVLDFVEDQGYTDLSSSSLSQCPSWKGVLGASQMSPLSVDISLVGGGSITAGPFNKSVCRQPDPLTKDWTVCLLLSMYEQQMTEERLKLQGSWRTGLQIIGLLTPTQNLPDGEFRGKDTLGCHRSWTCQQKGLFLMLGRS